MFCPTIVSILIVSVFADSPPSYHTYEEAKIPYAYSYSVKDEYHGTDFNAAESSDGKIVEGQYSVLLPDGRRQNVKYAVDRYNGYIADVSYEGQKIAYPSSKPYKQGVHPHPAHKPQRIYYPTTTKSAYKPATTSAPSKTPTITSKPATTTPNPVIKPATVYIPKTTTLPATRRSTTSKPYYKPAITSAPSKTPATTSVPAKKPVATSAPTKEKTKYVYHLVGTYRI